jgi:hypothetical protein
MEIVESLACDASNLFAIRQQQTHSLHLAFALISHSLLKAALGLSLSPSDVFENIKCWCPYMDVDAFAPSARLVTPIDVLGGLLRGLNFQAGVLQKIMKYRLKCCESSYALQRWQRDTKQGSPFFDACWVLGHRRFGIGF